MPEWKERFRPSGGWGYLEHAANRQAVDVVLEPYYHLTAGTYDMGIVGDGGDYDLPEDDGEAARELLRRAMLVMEMLEVMPKAAASSTAADSITRHLAGRKTPITASYQPALEGTASGQDLPERALNWNADRVDPDQLQAADRLVVIDQRAAYLNAAQQDLGWGAARHVPRGEAEVMIAGKSLPQGWWLIDIPGYDPELSDPGLFPVPRPLRTIRGEDGKISVARTEGVWVTTETLKHLRRPEETGGAGVRPGVRQAWVFPESGRPLVDWVERVKIALWCSDLDECERPMRWQRAMSEYYFKRIYKSYIGRMAAASTWRSDEVRQHIQPYWEQTIIARARSLAMLRAAKIRTEHGLTPLSCETDAWTYLVPEGIDLADTFDGKAWLGKYKLEGECVLTPDDREALATTTGADFEAVVSKLKVRAKGEVAARGEAERKARVEAQRGGEG